MFISHDVVTKHVLVSRELFDVMEVHGVFYALLQQDDSGMTTVCFPLIFSVFRSASILHGNEWFRLVNIYTLFKFF